MSARKKVLATFGATVLLGIVCGVLKALNGGKKMRRRLSEKYRCIVNDMEMALDGHFKGLEQTENMRVQPERLKRPEKQPNSHEKSR